MDFLFERPEEGIEADAEMIRVSLYDQLISFLEEDVFNMTSAGYFSKAFLAIIKKRGFDVSFIQIFRYGLKLLIINKFYLI